MSSTSGMGTAISKRMREIWKLSYGERFDLAMELEESKDELADYILLHLSDDRSCRVRGRAISSLWKRGGPIARIAARACSQDPETTVRDEAAEALGDVGNRLDVPRLIVLLHDPAWIVRASAAGSLGILGGATAKKALMAALTKDLRPDVKRYAASGLGQIGGADVISFLEDKLDNEKNPEVLTGLLSGLYTLGQSERLQPLLELLNDEDYMVRCQVLDGLQDGRQEDRASIIASLERLLQHEDHAAVIENARKVLGCLTK